MMTVVRLYVDDARIGSGWRLFVVLRIGRARALLLEPIQLVTLTVDRATLERHGQPCPGVKPARLAKRIRANLRALKRLGLRHSSKGARAAIEILGMGRAA